METFCLPLRELQQRFTLSELVFMGWRSQEQAYHLRKRTKGSGKGWAQEPSVRQRKQYDGMVPEGLPDRFFDENGEVNLSKVTVRDAVKYMHALGFKIPPGGGVVGA